MCTLFKHIYTHYVYTDHMALKFFPETILLLKVVRFEGILYRVKIDGMMNDHLSSCNS